MTIISSLLIFFIIFCVLYQLIKLKYFSFCFEIFWRKADVEWRVEALAALRGWMEYGRIKTRFYFINNNELFMDINNQVYYANVSIK